MPTAADKLRKPVEAEWQILKPKGPEHAAELVGANPDIDKFVLDVIAQGKASERKKLNKLDFNIRESIIDGEIHETMEGATNLTVTFHDPEGKLYKSGIFHEDIKTKKQGWKTKVRRIDVEFDRLWFRLRQVQKTGLDLVLTFEDRSVTRLRMHVGPKKAARGKVTRAEFIQLLARSIKSEDIRFFAPELHAKQDVGKKTRAEKRELKDRKRQGGMNPDAKIKIKGQVASAAQLKNLETLFEVAQQVGAGKKATKACIAACINESSVRNLTYGDSSSVGILQLLDIHLKGSKSTNGGRRDVELVIRMFFTKGFSGRGGAIQLENENPSMDFADIAAAVEGARGGRSVYATWGPEADAILDGWGTLSHRRLYRRYEFKVEKNEDYWTAALRLAEEVNWRLFMVRGWLYYISEDDLVLSRPRINISEDHDAVEFMDWDIDEGKPFHTMTVQTRIHRWGAPPGSVVAVEDSGPANGRWLVFDINRKMYLPDATITLKRATPAKLEPRPELRSQSDAKELGGDGNIDRLRAAVTRMSHKYPYIYGGGHSKPHIPPADSGGWDCSSGAASALAAAGLAPSDWDSGIPASGTMASTYGKPGQGKKMTLWANNGHVYLEIFFEGKWHHAGTGRWGQNQSGFGWQPNLHPHAGFTPRHWPGL